MEKSSSIFTFRAVGGGFLLALAMIACFEFCLGLVPEHKLLDPPYEQAALSIKGRLVDTPNSFDVLAVGDCTGWAAIKPLVLEELLGCTAFNLGVNGAQTYLMSYILLKRYLTNCSHYPKAVILQISASSLFYLYELNSEALANHILPWFRLDSDFTGELPWRLRMVCYKHKVLQLLPSFKNQYFLRKNKWFMKLFQQTKQEYDRYMRYYHEQNGFYNEDFDPAKTTVEEITEIGENFEQFIISDYNMVYITKIINVLREKGIRTVVCTTPVRDDEMRIWQKFRLRSRLMNFVGEKLKGYDSVAAFWDFSGVASDPDYFVDRIHLGNEGAVLYSRTLAAHIKKHGILR